MKNPFIPNTRAKVAIVDGRVSEEILVNLKKLNLDIIKTIGCKEVDDSVAYHPDIVIHPLSNRDILIAGNVFDYYSKLLSKYDFNLIRGKKRLGLSYPEDIAYNIARLNGFAIHNTKHTDGYALEYFQKNNIELINVKQGYSKCSLGIIGQTMAITSDLTIYKKLIERGFEILLINPGNIKLEGQNYGFIGGCMGNLSEDTVLISGSLRAHPDEKNIEEFIRAQGKSIIYLSKEEIIDIGTIMIL